MLRALGLVALALLAGCVDPDRSFLPSAANTATPGPVGPFNGTIRAWGDIGPDEETGAFGRALSPGEDGVIDILALSGGGAGGAFGAGLLRGWTESGTRPDFDLVTGVSAGAIIAPLALQGPRSDDALEHFFTALGTADLVDQMFVDALRGGPSAFDPVELRQIVRETLDAAYVAELAEAHRAGRRLLIVTTNLDAQRPVIWDMGAIAASGQPGAGALMEDVILASAAIPGVFPPVEFAQGGPATGRGELHVDGGVTQGIFGLPYALDLEALRGQKVRVWAVLNAKIAPEPEGTRMRLVDITNRAMNTLLKAQRQADVNRIAQRGLAIGAEVRTIATPDWVDLQTTELFDPTVMTRLYDLGRRMGQDPTSWTRVTR